MAGKCHVRSVSFPSRSHPSTTALEQELNKLRTLDASSASTTGSVYALLSGLDDLYRCTNGLLNVASTQQVLSQNQNRKYVDELLEESLRILDTCSIVRDIVSQTKEHLRCLQSAVRRRKGDSSIESTISDYVCFRKKMKKEARRLAASLKRMDDKIIRVVEQAVIRALREVHAMNASVFQSLSSFLSAPSVSKTRQSKWSLVSKLMHKGTVVRAEKEEIVNEIETLDAAISKYASCAEETDAEKKQKARKSLEALEGSIEGFESRLECVFRRLIKTRA